MVITLVSVFTAAVVFYFVMYIFKLLPKWLSMFLRFIAFSAVILFLSYLIDFTIEIIHDYRVNEDYVTSLRCRIDSLEKQNKTHEMQIQTLIKQDSFFDKELTYIFD